MYATIDIETTGLNRFKDKVTWIGIGLSKRLDEPFFKEYYLDMRADKNLDKFCQVVDRLREHKVKTVFQNGKFDTLFLEAQYGVKLPIHEDVMLMGTAYDLADEHGLKPMAQRYLGVPDWDISKKEKLSGDDSIIPYLKCDVRYTWELFCYFKNEMSSQQTKIYKKILLPAYLMYRDTERNGIYIDLDKLKEVRKMFKDREKEKLDWLKSKYDINWNSPAQIAEVLFEKEGMPVMKKSQKTNKPSADAEVLNKLARKGYEIPKVLLEYKSANTLNKMFLNRWEDDLGFDKRIHPSFNLTNVVTGRTSCLISGTKIRMADGSVKDIENVVPGNKVCCKTAKGISKGTVTWSGCTGIRNDLYRITAALETDPMTTRGIILTSDHPVLTTTRGFVRADRLKIGEMLIGFKENVRIIHIKKIHMGTKVYDLTVEKDHNFFANDICVHNCSDPNLQQVPREKSVRGMFDAPKGRLFFEADYSQLELRIAAEYSHDPVMLDIYKNKGDIHTTTAKLMTGGREPTKEERSKAKAVNFGFLYGMSARTFVDYAYNSYGAVFSRQEAELFREAFFNKYIRLLPWHKEMEYECELLGGVANKFGRFRKLPDIYNQDNFLRSKAARRAINTPVQGTGSDLLISAATKINHDLKKEGVKIVGTVHDSILGEFREEDKEWVCDYIRKVMLHPPILDDFGVELEVPLDIDIGVGAWGTH